MHSQHAHDGRWATLENAWNAICWAHLASRGGAIGGPVRPLLLIYARILTPTHIVETGNESHRYNQSSQTVKSRIKEREQSRQKIKAEHPEEPF